MRKRPSSRLLILDRASRLLLFRFRFTTRSGIDKQFWATPGGGLEGSESHRQAAQRELVEETGITTPVGDEIARRDSIYELPEGETVRAHERFFIVRVTSPSVRVAGQSRLEQQVIRAHRWWSLPELEATNERVYPEDLALLLESHLE